MHWGSFFAGFGSCLVIAVVVVVGGIVVMAKGLWR